MSLVARLARLEEKKIRSTASPYLVEALRQTLAASGDTRLLPPGLDHATVFAMLIEALPQ
ncbi:MAG: hypothetical protein NTW42_04490 [Deltaproteobacteria bacterium]|nr:hypothetical protein [Deltaproteobacteria bacterium]